jgi:hypothetical protein
MNKSKTRLFVVDYRHHADLLELGVDINELSPFAIRQSKRPTSDIMSTPEVNGSVQVDSKKTTSAQHLGHTLELRIFGILMIRNNFDPWKGLALTIVLIDGEPNSLKMVSFHISRRYTFV